MTLIQQIGFFIMNLLIGKANDYSGAGLEQSAWLRPGHVDLLDTGLCGLALAILLRIRETGPHGHGLETITTKTGA